MAKRNKGENPKAQPKPFQYGRFILQRSFWLLGKHGRNAIFTVGACYCAWVISDAIKALAGKQSNADLRFAIFADIRFVL
jgi:hypothetical protein